MFLRGYFRNKLIKLKTYRNQELTVIVPAFLFYIIAYIYL